MLLTGNLAPAATAHADGLITEVVAKDEINTKVQTVINDLLEGAATHSLTSTKKLIGRVLDLPLDDALEYAAEYNAETREHPACRQGIAAFLNKEKVTW